jgi:hypothetical protein
MTRRKRAEVLNTQAMALQDERRLKEASALFLEAAAADPTWAAPLYNLGLLFKRERNWRLSAKYNRRATKIDTHHEAAWWNLGIAATAVRRWKLARAAWRGFGIKLPDGAGPVELPCGFGPIRLDPDGDAEVVWAYRLDPARAELVSIPFPESGFRWRDIVLNDGAPVGYRMYKGQEVPVLNAIEVFEPSTFGTFVAHVHLPNNEQYLARLAEVAAKLGGSAEDWSTSVRILCRACSEGRPHGAHDTEAKPPEGAHIIGIAAQDRRHASTILATWEKGLDDVRVESLGDPVDREPRAR